MKYIVASDSDESCSDMVLIPDSDIHQWHEEYCFDSLELAISEKRNVHR